MVPGMETYFFRYYFTRNGSENKIPELGPKEILDFTCFITVHTSLRYSFIQL